MKVPLWIPPIWIAVTMGVYLWQQRVSSMVWGREIAGALTIGGGSILLWLALKDRDGEDDEE